MLAHCRKVGRGPSVWRFHFLLLGSLASSQFKDICVRLVGDSMAAAVSGCLCVFALRQSGNLFRVYPATLPVTAVRIVDGRVYIVTLCSLHGVSQLPCRVDSAQTHTSDIRAGRRGMAQTIHPLNNHKGSLLGGRWKKGCCLAVYSSIAL